jgi:hypothetical protein
MTNILHFPRLREGGLKREVPQPGLFQNKGEDVMIVYLDSSAIVKRCVKEMGSDSVDLIYHAGERNPINTLVFSLWNLGKVFGTIDARFQRWDLRQETKTEVLSSFSQETKFAAMRKISIIPVCSLGFSPKLEDLS